MPFCDCPMAQELRQAPPGHAAAEKSPDALAVQVGGAHYKSLKIQPVEFIEANGIPFLEGCVIKRMVRHAAKNGAEDIRKAMHECRLILKLRYGIEEA